MIKDAGREALCEDTMRTSHTLLETSHPNGRCECVCARAGVFGCMGRETARARARERPTSHCTQTLQFKPAGSDQRLFSFGCKKFKSVLEVHPHTGTTGHRVRGSMHIAGPTSARKR